MYRGVLGAVVAVAIAAGIWWSTTGSAAHRPSPPPGLTGYGRAVWNLDALLRDNFGPRQVVLNARRSYPRAPANFCARFINLARSRIVVYTFANAHGSAFTLAHRGHRPRPHIGASGWDVPLTLRGSYISCGHGRWLYEHGGEAYANWVVSCRTNG